MRGKNHELVTIGHYPDLSVSGARKEARRLLWTISEAKPARKTWREAPFTFVAEN